MQWKAEKQKRLAEEEMALAEMERIKMSEQLAKLKRK
jgi:hypothetical protein